MMSLFKCISGSRHLQWHLLHHNSQPTHLSTPQLRAAICWSIFYLKLGGFFHNAGQSDFYCDTSNMMHFVVAGGEYIFWLDMPHAVGLQWKHILFEMAATVILNLLAKQLLLWSISWSMQEVKGGFNSAILMKLKQNPSI